MRVLWDLLCTIPMEGDIATLEHVVGTPASISSLPHCGIAVQFGEDLSSSSSRGALSSAQVNLRLTFLWSHGLIQRLACNLSWPHWTKMKSFC